LVAQETARLDSLRAYDADYLIPLKDDRVEFSSYPDVTLERRGTVQFQESRIISKGSPRPLKKVRA